MLKAVCQMTERIQVFVFVTSLLGGTMSPCLCLARDILRTVWNDALSLPYRSWNVFRSLPIRISQRRLTHWIKGIWAVFLESIKRYKKIGKESDSWYKGYFGTYFLWADAAGVAAAALVDSSSPNFNFVLLLSLACLREFLNLSVSSVLRVVTVVLSFYFLTPKSSSLIHIICLCLFWTMHFVSQAILAFHLVQFPFLFFSI